MKKILTLLMFVSIFAMALGSPTLNKDYKQYATTALISPEKAYEMLQNQDNIVILDTRQKADFEKGHIEGSLDIWRPQYGADKGEYEYGGMRGTPEKLEKTLSAYGITPDMHIILAQSSHDSTRLFWLLEMYGHEKINLIDGGTTAWKNAGLPLVTGEAKRLEPSNYEFKNEMNFSKLAKLEDVVAGINDPNVIILDTRTQFEHDGLALFAGAFTKGRIPSPYYLEWNKLINSDRTFKSVEEIEKMLASRGITRDKTIISYCQSGVRSAHTTFVLSKLLGWENVKNYDGSWIEWSYNVVNGNVENQKDNIVKVIFSYLTNREKLELVLSMLGVWGPLAYIVIFALVTATMISVVPVTIAGGIIFGPVTGILYTAIGAGLGLSLAFLIARYVARGAIERKFGNTPAFKKIDEGVKRDGWFILATTRLLPIFPFGIQNYVYGLTSIGFVQYAVLSTIFILPGTSVFVMLAGAFASGDTKTVVTYSILASLIFFGLMVITKIIKKKSNM